MAKVKPLAILSTAAVILCFARNNLQSDLSSVSSTYKKNKPPCSRDDIRGGKWLEMNNTNTATATTGSSIQYQWVPDGATHYRSTAGWCRYRLEFDTELFCQLCKNMAIMFIGDSLNWELYQSLVHLLGAKVYKQLHVKAVYGKKIVKMNVCGGNNVTLIYGWNKQLIVTGRGTSISIDKMLHEHFPTMIILNTGAHYQPDNQFRGNVKKTLDKIAAWQTLCENRNLTCPFFWKTSVPGIPNCTSFTEPVNDIHKMELHVALNTVNNYNWDKFKGQNEIAMQLLNQSQLEFEVLDAYEVGIQRPELHNSDEDCLHNYDLAASDALNIILLHYLERTRTIDDVLKMENYHYDFNRSTNVSPDGYDFLGD